MSKAPSRTTKLARHMGEGVGKDYLPYITTNEFNSQGTAAIIPDWKTGRGVHCLSQAEAYWYYVLRWDEDNIDIREQFPLDRDTTEEIADRIGIKHPGNKDYVMTTDFLVTRRDGAFKAYSVKTGRNLSDRAMQILCIEKIYWMNKGVDFAMLFREDINNTLVSNIRNVVMFYDEGEVFDEISFIKHKIAVKEIQWDMENRIISNDALKELKI